MQKTIERWRYMAELDAFRDDRGHVKVLTGIRRCGKSTLLMQFMEKLRKDGVSEDEMLMVNMESSEFNSLSDYRHLNSFMKDKVPAKGRFYLFLDEIQRVDGWEKTVNALMVDTEADIYIAGSNAHLLSTDLSTYLTGRYVEVRMLPLSFAEYSELRGCGRPSEEVFAEYFRYGGFPGIDPSRGEQAVSAMTSDLYASVVFRDMVSRGKIRKPEELEKMVTYLMLNIGNQIETAAIAKKLKMNVRTVERYLAVVQGACMFYRADKYDLKSTALSPTPKYYVVDPGLLNNAVGMASKDRGRVLENIVFLELKRRGYEIVVGKWDSKEVDFVTEMNGRTEYWQVCWGYHDDETEARELAPLRAIRDNNPKTVVLMDYSGDSVTRDGIREVGIVDFLLGDGKVGKNSERCVFEVSQKCFSGLNVPISIIDVLRFRTHPMPSGCVILRWIIGEFRWHHIPIYCKIVGYNPQFKSIERIMWIMTSRFVQRSELLVKLSKFKDKTEFIKVITGVRRCGKSTLLKQFIHRLGDDGVSPDDIFWYNFESLDYEDVTDFHQLNELLRKIPKNRRCYVFLDEIQTVANWERSVNGLMSDTEADIYITGSNAHLLSGELATLLTGRYVEFEVFPLSFREYTELNDGYPEERLFQYYLRYGGFPAVRSDYDRMIIDSYLRDLHNSIIYEDVVSRGKIRKTAELEKVVRYLMRNVGNISSTYKMAEELSIDRSTVDGFVKLLEQACLIYRANRFDIVSTELRPTPKYYSVDQGLRGNIVGFSDLDVGRILENVVYIELLRRGFKVQVGSFRSGEIDFVVESAGGSKAYIQVCKAFSDESVREREIALLMRIRDNHPKAILVGGEISHTDGNGISIIDIRDWLLGRASWRRGSQ